MNPWSSVWLHPRRTLRHLADTDPRRFALPLAVATGALELCFYMMNRPEEGIPILAVAATALGVGAGMGAAGLYVMGWAYRQVGVGFGGQGTGPQIRAAIAWGELPRMVVFLMWAALMFMTAGRLPEAWRAAADPAVGLPVTDPLAFSAAGFVLLFLTGFLWHFAILCGMIAEAHRFPGWKGLVTVLIPNMVLLLILLILVKMVPP